MDKKTKLITIAVFVLASVAITLFNIKKNDDVLAMQLQSYTESEALVVKVYPPTFSRYGSKRKTYDLLVTLADSTTILLRKKVLDGHFEEATRIQLLYNPSSYADEVFLSNKK